MKLAAVGVPTCRPNLSDSSALPAYLIMRAIRNPPIFPWGCRDVWSYLLFTDVRAKYTGNDPACTAQVTGLLTRMDVVLSGGETMLVWTMMEASSCVWRVICSTHHSVSSEKSGCEQPFWIMLFRRAHLRLPADHKRMGFITSFQRLWQLVWAEVCLFWSEEDGVCRRGECVDEDRVFSRGESV